MRKIQFAIAVLIISSVCFARDISEQYNRITSHSTKGAMQNDIGNTKDSWQPMAMSMPMPMTMSRHNWIVLNTKIEKKYSTSAEAHTAPMSPSNHRSSSSSSYSHLSRRHHHLSPSDGNAYEQKQQQTQSHRLPINYYTYNHSSDGNFVSPSAADVKLIEPYIVTISEMNAPSDAANSGAALSRLISPGIVAADASSTFADAVTLPKDIIGSLVSPQNEWSPDVESSRRPNNGKGSRGGSDGTATTSVPDENNDKTESFFEKTVSDGAHLNEIFLPLRKTLDNVIYFCDVAKRFIAENADDGGGDDNDDDSAGVSHDGEDVKKDDTKGNDLNTKDDPSGNTHVINTAPDGVQGHQSISPKATIHSLLMNTSTGRSRHMTSTQKSAALSSAVGTGRKIKKWKKKLSKFILPLLLAYKLKFLTLIPVFIGGLILLVGTTGLAGFFFALFTAVMSLKSTGSGKSIIVKKI